MLHAAIIPGAQDHPDDWEDVKNECKDFIEFTHFPRPPFQEPNRKNREQWNEVVNQHYATAIDKKSYDLIVAHSRGCRYALEWLLANQESTVQGALLLNPATKNPNAVCKRKEHGTYSSIVEELLASLLVTLTDDQADLVLSRHRAAYENSPTELARIILELRLLCSESILEDIRKVRAGMALTIVGSEFDPYFTNVSGLMDNKKATSIVINRSGEERGHYHHIEQPREISEYLCAFAKEIGLIIDDAPVNSHRSALQQSSSLA